MKKTLVLLFVLIATICLWLFKNDLTSRTISNGLQITSTSSTPETKTKDRQISMNEIQISDSRSAIEIATELINSKKQEWRIQSYHEMRSKELTLPLGSKISYEFFQDNIPLLGQSIHVVVSRKGKILSIENNYHALEKADLSAVDFASIDASLKEKYNLTELSAPILYEISGLTKPQLAYPITLNQGKGPEVELLIRASDGELLSKSSGRKEF